jgi:hypothetical protein
LALSAYLILNIIGGQSLVNPNLTIAPTQDFVSVRPTELSAGGSGGGNTATSTFSGGGGSFGGGGASGTWGDQTSTSSGSSGVSSECNCPPGKTCKQFIDVNNNLITRCLDNP